VCVSEYKLIKIEFKEVKNLPAKKYQKKLEVKIYRIYEETELSS
jgi:hypothetical protein